jgi:hypothetical protein
VTRRLVDVSSETVNTMRKIASGTTMPGQGPAQGRPNAASARPANTPEPINGQFVIRPL